MNRFEPFLYGFACGLILLASYILIEPAIGYERVPPNLPTDKRPVIPVCEKEIFERIVDGCGETDEKGQEKDNAGS